jgi:hypothetical protein
MQWFCCAERGRQIIAKSRANNKMTVFLIEFLDNAAKVQKKATQAFAQIAETWGIAIFG